MGQKNRKNFFKKGDINWRILIAASKLFKKAASCVVAFGGRSMTYLELIILFGCTRGPWVSVISSVYLSVSVFADLLLLFLFPALTCSSVSVSIWISVHSYDNDNEIVSVLSRLVRPLRWPGFWPALSGLGRPYSWWFCFASQCC